MEHGLTISEVAAEVGLSAKAIRFYEEAGVIKPLARGANQYRRFSERDVQRLRLIQRVRGLGLPLSEIKNIVSTCIDKGCADARQYVAAQVPRYIKEVDERLAELQALKTELQSIQEHYRRQDKTWQHSTDACCKILPLQEGER